MDLNRDGLIDVDEFAYALKKTFGMDFLTRLEITAIMSRCDRGPCLHHYPLPTTP